MEERTYNREKLSLPRTCIAYLGNVADSQDTQHVRHPIRDIAYGGGSIEWKCSEPPPTTQSIVDITLEIFNTQVTTKIRVAFSSPQTVGFEFLHSDGRLMYWLKSFVPFLEQARYDEPKIRLSQDNFFHRNSRLESELVPERPLYMEFEDHKRTYAVRYNLDVWKTFHDVGPGAILCELYPTEVLDPTIFSHAILVLVGIRNTLPENFQVATMIKFMEKSWQEMFANEQPNNRSDLNRSAA